MPTYEFRCIDGHTFERFYRKISDAPLESEVKCPECGKPATRMLSAGGGLLFKGSGFYLTDYGKNAHRAPEAAKPAAEGAAASGDAKPAESKPAETKAAETKATEPTSKSSKSDSAPPGGASPSSSSSSGSSSPKSDT
jgi:putative FmdB family regulatory protein